MNKYAVTTNECDLGVFNASSKNEAIVKGLRDLGYTSKQVKIKNGEIQYLNESLKIFFVDNPIMAYRMSND